MYKGSRPHPVGGTWHGQVSLEPGYCLFTGVSTSLTSLLVREGTRKEQPPDRFLAAHFTWAACHCGPVLLCQERNTIPCGAQYFQPQKASCQSGRSRGALSNENRDPLFTRERHR